MIYVGLAAGVVALLWVLQAYLLPHTAVILVRTTEDCSNKFISVSADNVHRSREEPGNRLFELHQSKMSATTFLLIESYKSRAAARGHKRTAHYALWRKSVAPYMATERSRIRISQSKIATDYRRII